MSEDIAAEAVKEVKPKSRSSEKSRPRQAYMYVGPNRPYDLPLMRNQVIIGSAPPDGCLDLVKVKPHFADCFINVSKAGAALVALRDQASDLSRAAAKVASETAEQHQAASGGN